MADVSQGEGTFLIHQPTYEKKEHSLTLTCTFESQQTGGDTHFFTETYEFTFPDSIRLDEVDPNQVNAIARLVAVSAAPSYYKATVLPLVVLDFPVSTEIKEWMRALFDQGLREFRYRNGFDLTKEVDLSSLNINDTSVKNLKTTNDLQTRSKYLVPIGGGKDSATTLHILSRSGADVVGFSIGDFDSINETARVAGIELVRVARSIDPLLFELNARGAPNGHVPVTAITSTLACIAALGIGADAVVMSNERSADEPTRVVADIEVNHQWSKSWEAEKLLRSALDSSGCGIEYFSLLRSLSEYEIFSIFSHCDEFHTVFTSCNRTFRIDETQRASTWCADCDKCRFVFLGLSAFRGVTYASNIFGVNMFDDESQKQGFLDLLGMSDTKPFECVGTVRESRMLVRNALKWDAAADSVVGKTFADVLVEVNTLDEKIPVISFGDFVPEDLQKNIVEIQVEQYKEHLKAHLSDQTIGVMGLGRDTSAMIRFLDSVGYAQPIQVFQPSEEVLTEEDFREEREKAGLENISIDLTLTREIADLNADIVFVSPGISRYSPEVQSLGDRATTPLAWWLSYNKEHFPSKCFIGVTGTKGKSTTASMLGHVLDRSIVAGNLGHAVGEISVNELLAADYIVLEVSSYQASYVTTSPDVVAVTSLFDCHIDWHRTPENYRKDKLNLALQGPSEIVASDTIDDFAPMLIDIRKEHGFVDHVDVITFIASSERSLLERNHDMVRAIAELVAPHMPEEEITEKLATFTQLKHRQEIIATKNGVVYVSDVLCTAPLAVLMAVDDFSLRYPNATIYLLCGGADRHDQLDPLIEGLNARKDRVTAITLPQTGHMMEGKLENAHHCDELSEAVLYVASVAKSGDV
ncbi:MAG TPA: Mur ligase family protein, partial [Acidimicrobiia bacterium]|nr:Mur ligase family protein [Acidimicrobiia bacterium]